MHNPSALNPVLIWGSNPALQFEVPWITELFSSFDPPHVEWWHPDHPHPLLPKDSFPVLIESGLTRLESSPSLDRLRNLDNARATRISFLNCFQNSKLIHVSDEEGHDAHTFYKSISPDVTIWRNFPSPSVDSIHPNFSFPIGPRSIFLSLLHSDITPELSSLRRYSWSFMGTIWSSGSRLQAVSNFLRTFPDGFYFGGKSFGSGLPLDKYCSILSTSSFALCPEGDRHLDTFRLWECLCCGCIPILVDFKSQASSLLPESFPIPIFSSWKSSLDFVHTYLSDPVSLNNLQSSVFTWWKTYKNSIQSQITAIHVNP